ncbi:hypothetical protein BG011_009385 [Mortierella polycephala]|uniref:SEC7 domain-containing protein n=1 Tax=Mortierella polycephala TaxID=41804 RepID=A0A9P6PN22_9FUNG|nr:hypothetical protein BG011_009385 [Mortierella polycephala]
MNNAPGTNQHPQLSLPTTPPTHSPRTRAQFYHSEPLPQSPTLGQFPVHHQSLTTQQKQQQVQQQEQRQQLLEPASPKPSRAPQQQKQDQQLEQRQQPLEPASPKPSRASTDTARAPPSASRNGTFVGGLNLHSLARNGSSSFQGERNTSVDSNAGSERLPVQFSTSEIERSFQALLKKQPMATVGPSVLHGKSHRHLHSKDSKPRHFLSPNTFAHHHYHSKQQDQQQEQLLHQGSPNSNSSSFSNTISHSPIFGSPAAEHARHWIKTVGQGRDHISDSESEQRENNSDQDHDCYDDGQQQQWQIDYDHHVAGHVELETEADTARKQPDLPSKVHPILSMADQQGSREQVLYPGLVSPATRPLVRIKDRHTVHPLSPVPPSPGPGTSTPRISQSGSPEMRPQVVFHPSDLAHAIDIGSIPPPASSTINQPLPPLPAPPTTLPEQPRPRSKHIKHSGPSKKTSRNNVLAVKPIPMPTPVMEKKPISLTNPPRKCIHHGKILQIINTSTVKDRYLFLFSDILLIAKPMSDGHPTIDSRFQVKEIIELKKISLSLTRDKYDPKNGEAGALGNRKVSPILAEFIHTFDQNPARALNTFIHKRALHPDPVSEAHLLYKTPELSKTQLALFLSQPANKHVYRAFLDHCQFSGVLLDEALRTLLGRLSLPERMGAQQVGGPSDRIVNSVDYLLEEFTRRWYEVNVNVVVFDASIAHKLVIAMIVLNAQLHNNEGASLIKDREEVGILVRPRVASQPSTPTIPSAPVMESTLSAPPVPTSQQYMTMGLDNLTAFPTPSKDSFVEAFQLLDQQRIVPRDTLHNIFLSISHQPLDIGLEKLDTHTASTDSSPAAVRKLWPIMMSPSILPPRLTLKIPSDPITITVPVLNPRFSIHLGGRDLKCDPPVLEFGSHRSQRFRITGLVPGKKTLTIHPKLNTDKGLGTGGPEQYYDLQNLPTKHTIAIERQFMRHTFQISLLNDVGTRRRYLLGTSSAVEKDEWARVLTECLLAAKGQNAVRLNQHTGLEQSIGLQILKELLLGVEASDEDEMVPAQPNGQMDQVPMPLPMPVAPPANIALGIPLEKSAARSHASVAGPNAVVTSATVLQSPTLGSGANAEWTTATVHVNGFSTSPKDTWMCKMPKLGTIIPDRHGWELVRLVEQNSLMALVLGFMGALGRDRLRRMEAVRKAMEEEEARLALDEAEEDEDEDEVEDDEVADTDSNNNDDDGGDDEHYQEDQDGKYEEACYQECIEETDEETSARQSLEATEATNEYRPADEDQGSESGSRPEYSQSNVEQVPQ